jgi:hypothetical protein
LATGSDLVVLPLLPLDDPPEELPEDPLVPMAAAYVAAFPLPALPPELPPELPPLLPELPPEDPPPPEGT